MYIIVPNKRAGGTSEDLCLCLEALKGMPGVNVTKIVGNAPNLLRLHVEAIPDAVEKLRQDFGSRLIIESDRQFGLLG